MGNSDTAVAISIVVKDDGSLALIDAAESKLVKLQNVSVGAGSAVGKIASSYGLVGANLSALNSSLSSTTQSMTGFAGASIAGVDSLNHSLEGTKGNIREVGGLGREMGLNLGYSLKHAVADNELLMGGLRALSGLFVGIAAIDIGVQIVEGLEHVYEKWFDVNKEVLAYQQEAQQAADQKLFDTASLEETVALLNEINGQVQQLRDKRTAVEEVNTKSGIPFAGFLGAIGGGFGGEYATGESEPGRAFTPTDDKTEADERRKADILAEHKRQLDAQTAQEGLKGQAAYDEAVGQGYAKIASHEKDALAEINQRYDAMKQHEENLVKIHNDVYAAEKAAGENMQGKSLETADPHAFDQQRQAAITAAQQEAAGQHVALVRQETEEEIQMRNEAVEAGMRGEALYDYQRQAAEDAIKRKMADTQISGARGKEELADLDMKFHNAKMARLDEEQYETMKIQREAAQAGLTGIAKIQAEGQNKAADLSDPSHPLSNDQAVQQRKVAIAQETNQQIVEEQKQFAQQIQQITERSDSQQIAGYARIESEAQKSLQRLQEEFQKGYGQLASDNPLRIQAEQQVATATTAIWQNAQRERVDLTQKTNEQIAQIEMQSARLSLPPWQAAQMQIVDEYQQRVQKAKELLDQQDAYYQQKLKEQGVLTQQEAADEAQIWSQYYRTITADAQLAAAQMQKQMEETRDQVAGQLQSMFDNPAKYMENRAKQLMMDILANWVTQLMQESPKMQGLLGGLFGMNKMSTSSNPMDAMKSVFGAHGTAGAANPMAQMGSTLSTAGSSLTTAGSTLNSAGSTLSSSSTMLASVATQLASAATALMNLAMSGGAGAGAAGGGGSVGAGAIGQLTNGVLGGITGSSSGGAGGGIESQIMSLPSSTGGLAGAYSLANEAGSAVGLAGSVSGASENSTGTIGMMSSLLGSTSSTVGSSAALMNPQGIGGDGGGMQATDLPPTSSSGVLGTVPDDATGAGASDSSAGSSGMGTALGVAGIGISTGMALSQEWQSGNTGAAILTGAMGGAGIGMMVGGPIGAAIGAAAGALVGFVGSLFSDHGLAKAKQYNTDTVLPTLQKEMDGFGGGGTGYDQASLDLNNLMIQAQAQCKSFGSAAVSYYNSTIVPEIKAMQGQIDRENKGGRSNVTMSSAQFDSGGIVSSFGDMATGPFSGFVHLRAGERVMNPMASMLHGSTLDAMNAGSSALAMMRRSAPLGSGGGSQGELHTHVHIHTLDSKTMDHWARNGGAQWLQAQVNANVGRYAGKALG